MRVVQEFEFDEFDWDPAKRQRTLMEREIDFADAAHALIAPHLEMDSSREGERRTLAICEIGDKIAAVVYTIRGTTCRIITARAARHYERREFRSIFGR